MIDICDLSFSFDGSIGVFKSVNLYVKTAQIVAIVGASGCGKSTLLRVIAGLYPATLKHILKGYMLIEGCSPTEYRRTGKLGFVFQQFELLPFLSVRDNITWPLKYSPLVSTLDPSHIMDIDVIIDAVGLQESNHKMPHELSGGMKARVAIARALITSPSLLLVDEAFSALDVGWRTSLHRLIKRLGDQFSMTTLIVSHNLDDVVTYADACLVLSASGTGATFIEFGDNSRTETMELLRSAILIGHQANTHDQS